MHGNKWLIVWGSGWCVIWNGRTNEILHKASFSTYDIMYSHEYIIQSHLNAGNKINDDMKSTSTNHVNKRRIYLVNNVTFCINTTFSSISQGKFIM